MSANGNQVPLAPNQRGHGPYARPPTPHRTECYNPPGGAAGGYMPAGTPTPTGPPLRVPSAQPTAPPPQQQERPTATMSAHNYGPPQAQTQQNRPPYPYQYRTAQHGSRPSTHPRQQQSYIPNATASNTQPVVYSMFPQAHLVHQTYPQQRTQGYYPTYVPSYTLGAYPNPMPSHTTPYYYPSGTQQIPTANLTAGGPAARGAGSLVGPQGAPPAPAASTTMQHPAQPPAHLHHNMSGDYHVPEGMHTNPGKRVSRRLPIIDPKTNQDIFQEINSNDSHHISGESSERQTPQPESLSVVEEFTRLVNEAANQPTASESAVKSNFLPKTSEAPIVASPPICGTQSPANVSTNNNVLKSDGIPTLNDTKNLISETAPEAGETPVVSAITDSPVIVPKVIPNMKQIQKNCEQSLSIDTNKNLASNSKYSTQSKTKPLVPENEDSHETATAGATATMSADSAPSTPPAPVALSLVQQLPPFIKLRALTPSADSAPTPTPTPAPTTLPAALPIVTSDSTVNATEIPVETSAPVEDSPEPPVSTSTSAPISVPDPATTPAAESVPVSVPVSPPASVPVQTPTQTLISNLTPQPPRVREPREKVKPEENKKQNESEPAADENKPNGPVPTVGTNSINSTQDIANLPTSQSSTAPEVLTIDTGTATNINSENENEQTNAVECETSKIEAAAVKTAPTPTELLSASIEAAGVKSTRESVEKQEPELELPELSVASQAQAKLNQSLASCNRNNLSKMKDINLNNKNTDLDTANGNITTETNEVTDNQEDNSKNNNQNPSVIIEKNTTNKMASGEQSPKENEMIENGNNETDTISNVEQENVALNDKKGSEIQAPSEKPVYVPKYKYNKDQWSPLNTSGKKCYDINFLKQVKDDPLSKNKPESAQKLEALKVMRTTPQETALQFASISKPINDSMLPNFMKGQVGARTLMRDPKKDNKTLIPGKGSVKSSAPLNMGSGHKTLIHVSISLREDVKLNETENAWKPSRFKSDSADQEQRKTEEVYKKFRGILNKLTPQKFDTLLERVKKLEIDTPTRLEGVIDLIFEKAIDEPNFSEAYASMCSKLSKLRVPGDNPSDPDPKMNFRNLIISRCQNQFVTNKVDEQVIKLEKELAECHDPAKKKELQLLLAEENRKIRMRSVGNVRFIGELYKLKMLTAKIMVFCMNYLIEKPEEEKLECLCKLLTTIGQQVECEARDQVEAIFKKMQDIVYDKKSHKISSRVRFMIQDVIELKKRNWVVKTVIDSQPKMMDQIQKEAEQQQRHIELMNSSMGSSFRRDDSGRGKRGGDGRRQGPNSFVDNNWSSRKQTFDVSKLKQGSSNKDVQSVKLAPHQSSMLWVRGSGTKATTQPSNISMSSTTTTNAFSVLDVNVSTDPTIVRDKDQALGYHSKGASIERSTFGSKGQVYGPNTSSRTGSMGTPRSRSGNRNVRSPGDSRNASPAPAPREPSPPPQEPKPVDVKKVVKMIITDWQSDNDEKAMIEEIKKKVPSSQYSAVIAELLNITVEMPTKDAIQVSKALHYLLSCNFISSETFTTCLSEILESAPDLCLDIPMLYENLGYILSPLIEKKFITFNEILKLSDNVIFANQGHLLLKFLIKELKSSVWQEAGLELRQWMDESQVAQFLEQNTIETVKEEIKVSEKVKKILTPAETQTKLLHLMNNEESCECICRWVKENLGEVSNEEWFMRSLIQAICEYAFYSPENRNVLHFKEDRLRKYIELIHEFGENKQARELNCLVGIQQLIHRLEHPQGLSVELFQYLHEQYIISAEGFSSWHHSQTELEGKGVMLKALTSFFINLKEAENDESCSED